MTKERGLVKINLDKERHLKFTLNTLIEVEESLGYSLADMGDKVSIKAIRTLLTAGLRHEDKGITEEFVGEFISMDNMAEVQDALGAAMGGTKKLKWEEVKKFGYGLLGLLPEQLYSLTLMEYQDMVYAKTTQQAVEDDKEMERTAWLASLLMSATGNYGKKGIDPKKLYTRQFDSMGNLLESEQSQGGFTPIDKEIKDKKLSELIAKFNKN